VFLAAPWLVTSGRPVESPGCGHGAQSRCCCLAASLLCTASEVCRACLSSLTRQAAAHLFLLFPGALHPQAPHSSGRPWPLLHPRTKALGHLVRNHWMAEPSGRCQTVLAPVSWQQLNSARPQACLKHRPPPPRGALCFFLTGWEPPAQRSKLSRRPILSLEAMGEEVKAKGLQNSAFPGIQAGRRPGGVVRVCKASQPLLCLDLWGCTLVRLTLLQRSLDTCT
jgi:hypothetical protein